MDKLLFAVDEAYDKTIEEGDSENEIEAENSAERNSLRPRVISKDSVRSASPEIPKVEYVEENITNAGDEIKIVDLVIDESEDLCKINTRPLSKNAATYELEKFSRSALLVFNHENIDGYSETRSGTDEDAQALKNTFENVSFEVTIFKDLSKKGIFEKMDEFFEQDFSDYGCVGVAVLTHGGINGDLRAKDTKYNELQILNYFRTLRRPTLATKPKLFIVQACRGSDPTQGVPVGLRTKKLVSRDLDTHLESFFLPEDSDILILHSSYLGKPSFREHHTGSWFIQTLCKKIDQFAETKHLESIVTAVKHEVALEKSYEEYDRVLNEVWPQKQMPISISTLTRKLYFTGRKVEKIISRDVSLARETSTMSLGTVDGNQTQCNNSSCFHENFSYMRKVLRYFLEENPTDTQAKSFLIIADTLKDFADKNKTNETLLIETWKYLRSKWDNSLHSKYVRFYGDIYE